MDANERLKQIPIITMLSAAGLTAIISLFSEITFGVFLLRIFIASIVFYGIGIVVLILFSSALKDRVESEIKSEEEASDGAASETEGSQGLSEDEYEEDEFEGL